MADKIEDGGPAYPRPEVWKPDGTMCALALDGMSLRDYFAAAALASVLSDHAHDWELTAWFGKHATGVTKQQILSRRAYDIADAMLSARKKGGE